MPSRFLTRYADITDHTAKSPTRCKNAEALAPNPCQLRKKFRVILFPGDLILRANWVRVSGYACCPLSHLVGTCMRQAFMCNGIRQFAPAISGECEDDQDKEEAT